MSWARVDDGWWCHPKVMGLSLSACGLWASALSWSAAHPDQVVPDQFLAMVGASTETAAELVAAGLWANEPTGYRICEMRQKRRPNIPTSTRRAVFERDGFACLICTASDDLTLDHIVAYSKGGPDTVENLRVLCRSCNSRKGDA